MSRFTTEVRYICENNAGLLESVGFSKVEETIQKAIPNVFDFNFPIFDEKYRNVIETKILRHYYTREIAHETVGLWKLKLSTKLNEIMPFYNKLYESELIKFNPMYDVDVTREHNIDKTGKRDTESTIDTSSESNEDNNQNVNGNLSSDTTGTYHDVKGDVGKRKRLHSDTPQGAISDLESGKYLSDADIDDNNNTVTTDGTTGENQKNDSEIDTIGSVSTDSNATTDSTINTTLKDTESYLETVKGKQGGQDFSDMLMKYRQTFLNIDMMVIEQLEELFFGLWDCGNGGDNYEWYR